MIGKGKKKKDPFEYFEEKTVDYSCNKDENNNETLIWISKIYFLVQYRSYTSTWYR